MDFDYLSAVISKYASKWYESFSPNSLYSRDDLIQEGYLEFLRVKDKYNDTKKASFGTFFTSCLITKYAQILRKSKYRSKIQRIKKENQLFDDSFKIKNNFSKNTEKVIKEVMNGNMPKKTGHRQRQKFIQNQIGLSDTEMQVVVNEIQEHF